MGWDGLEFENGEIVPVSYAMWCAGAWNRWGKVACLLVSASQKQFPPFYRIHLIWGKGRVGVRFQVDLCPVDTLDMVYTTEWWIFVGITNIVYLCRWGGQGVELRPIATGELVKIFTRVDREVHHLISRWHGFTLRKPPPKKDFTWLRLLHHSASHRDLLVDLGAWRKLKNNLIFVSIHLCGEQQSKFYDKGNTIRTSHHIILLIKKYLHISVYNKSLAVMLVSSALCAK